MTSKVYYMDARCNSPEASLVVKMISVYEAAGFDKLIKPGDLVAIKLHCGEWNNTAYLRPVYARALADKVKSLGGRPFVCDTTTLPYGTYSSRSTELDLLITAERNGYNSATLGCPFICADGFVGTDDYRVDLPEGYILKEAYIAEAIAAADVLITLTHFKGHAIGVFGGAMKNLGIGAQSKRGKFNVHMSGHPKYGFPTSSVFHLEDLKERLSEAELKSLEDHCPFGVIHVTKDSVKFESGKCVSCLACVFPMLTHGIADLAPEYFQATDAAIADACLATVKTVGPDKVAFINVAVDISRECDCVSYADVPILPHLGVFASSDPVAVDKACLDKAVETEGIQGSWADEMEVRDIGKHKFEVCSPLVAGMSEDVQINTGEIIGLGQRDYELITVAEKKMEYLYFTPDPRPVGLRQRKLFGKLQPFPYDRHNGKGFLREDEVDLERVNTYYDSSNKLSKKK